MTIVEQIAHEAQALPVKQRQEVLKIVRTMRSAKGESALATLHVKTLGKARRALRASKGLWRNRSDLPADTVEASIELRRRVMRRAKNG